MEFSDVASVSGKGGLFKVLSPTRSGVILESLDGSKKRLVAGMQTKVSVLSDISIYTTDGEGAVPLKDVMVKIHEEFGGDTGLSGTSDSEELKSFLKHVLPTYDEDRVYVSDIKKLVNWYNKLASEYPEVLTQDATEEKPEEVIKEDDSSSEDAKEG